MFDREKWGSLTCGHPLQAIASSNCLRCIPWTSLALGISSDLELPFFDFAFLCYRKDELFLFVQGVF